MKSIRQKLIFYTLLLIILPFLTSIILNSIYMNKTYSKELEKNNQVLASLIADQVTTFVDKSYSITEQIAMNNDIKGFQSEEQKQVLLDVIERHPYFELLYVQGTDGMQTARTSGELGDRSNRWWFQEVMKDKSSFVSKSYYTLNSNVAVTTIAMPIYDDSSNIIGVMGADLKLDALQDQVEKYSEGSQYALIVDGEGVVIAHPDTKQVSELYNYKTMKKTVLKRVEGGDVMLDADGNQVTEEQEIKVPDALKQIVENALNGQKGSKIYKNNDGVAVISAYQNISLPGTSDDWAVITVEEKADAMSFILNSEIFNLVLCLILIVISIIQVSIISSRITDPIKKSSIYLNLIAQGNFLVDVDAKILSRNDEIGIIANSIQKMKDSLKHLVSSIAEESDNIQSKVNIIMAEMEELNGNIESVSATSQELAANMEETAASSQEMSATSQEIEKAAQSIAENSQKGALAAKEISDRAEKTKENVDQSQQKAVAILVNTKERLEKAIEDSKVVEQISVLTNSIVQITEQTNLLALNAAIEAARAGESGRGFSVVADEIRDLAEKSKIAAKKISEVTGMVVTSVDNLTESANGLLTFVSTDVNRDYKYMLEVASRYSEDANYVDDLVNEFSATSEELLAAIDNIAHAIEGVAIAANESASGTTDIASRVAEANSESNNVMEKIQQTKESTDTLKEEISQFKI